MKVTITISEVKVELEKTDLVNTDEAKEKLEKLMADMLLRTLNSANSLNP